VWTSKEKRKRRPEDPLEKEIKSFSVGNPVERKAKLLVTRLEEKKEGGRVS